MTDDDVLPVTDSPMPMPARRHLSAVGATHAPYAAAWDAATLPTGYSVEKIYPAARITSGSKDDVAVSFTVRVPAWMSRQIDEIIQGAVIPEYGTRQDLFRDALLHRMVWIQERLGSQRLRSRMTVAMLDADIELQTREIEQTMAVLEKTKRLLEHARSVKDHGLVAEIRSWGRDSATQLREPYRGELLAILGDDDHADQ